MSCQWNVAPEGRDIDAEFAILEDEEADVFGIVGALVTLVLICGLGRTLGRDTAQLRSEGHSGVQGRRLLRRHTQLMRQNTLSTTPATRCEMKPLATRTIEHDQYIHDYT